MEQTGRSSNTRKQWIAPIGAILLAVSVWLFLQTDSRRDPVVDGKPISVWFQTFATDYWRPSRSFEQLPKNAEVFRKAGQAGVEFLVLKLTERSALKEKYVRFKSGSPDWVFKVLPTVRIGNWGQRECAALILGEIGPCASNAVLPLVATLDMTEVHETDKSTGASDGKSFSPFARSQAIRALARIAPDSPLVVSALIDALKQKYVWVPTFSSATSSPRQTSVATYAADALAGLGPEFKGQIPTMVVNLKYQDQRQFRGAGMAAVYPVGSPAPGYGESVPRLINALKDSAADTREAAAYDLGAIRRQEKKMAEAALPALVEALNDSEASVRIRVSETIMAIDPKRFELVLPTLVSLLTETNYVVRLRAIDLMRQAGPHTKDVVQLLTKSLKDDSRTVRTWAREALNQIGPEAAAKTGIE